MLGLILMFIMCTTSIKGQEDEIIVPDNKTQCVYDMMEWCDNMQYPQQSAGLAILSIVYEDPNGYYRVLCSSDSEGTNCTKDNLSWFACSPDHTLSYKGRIMTNETLPNDIDDDICETADKAFNEIYVQNLSYNNVTLENEVQKGMEAFFDKIAMLEEQIELIKRFLQQIPLVNDFWNLLDSELAEREYDLQATAPKDRKQTATHQTNQIEKK